MRSKVDQDGNCQFSSMVVGVEKQGPRLLYSFPTLLFVLTLHSLNLTLFFNLTLLHLSAFFDLTSIHPLAGEKAKGAKSLRKAAVDWLAENHDFVTFPPEDRPDAAGKLVRETREEFLARMGNDGHWGDRMTLQA